MLLNNCCCWWAWGSFTKQYLRSLFQKWKSCRNSRLQSLLSSLVSQWCFRHFYVPTKTLKHPWAILRTEETMWKCFLNCEASSPYKGLFSEFKLSSPYNPLQKAFVSSCRSVSFFFSLSQLERNLGAFQIADYLNRASLCIFKGFNSINWRGGNHGMLCGVIQRLFFLLSASFKWKIFIVQLYQVSAMLFLVPQIPFSWTGTACII